VSLSLLYCTLAEAVLAAQDSRRAAPDGAVLIGRPGCSECRMLPVPVPDFGINDRHDSAWKGTWCPQGRRSDLYCAAVQDYTGCSDKLDILRKWGSCFGFKHAQILVGRWCIGLVGSSFGSFDSFGILWPSFLLPCQSYLAFSVVTSELVSQDTSWTSPSLFVLVRMLAAFSTGLNLVIPRFRGITGRASSQIHARLAH
jgi:hypothetical protein